LPGYSRPSTWINNIGSWDTDKIQSNNRWACDPGDGV